jgi:hypothetical protein
MRTTKGSSRSRKSEVMGMVHSVESFVACYGGRATRGGKG